MSGYIVRDLGAITPTSSGATNSNIFTHLDDAESVGIFMTSSANAATSGVYVSREESATSTSLWFRYSSTGGGAVVTSSGSQIDIEPVAFRSLRFSGLSSGTAAEIIGYVTKQILV